MTPPIQREYVYEPFLLVNCLLPIRSPSYETQGLGGRSAYSFPPQGRDGWPLSCTLLAHQRPAIFLLHCPAQSRICMRTVRDAAFCALSRAEEEYLIRCNGIRVI